MKVKILMENKFTLNGVSPHIAYRDDPIAVTSAPSPRAAAKRLINALFRKGVLTKPSTPDKPLEGIVFLKSVKGEFKYKLVYTKLSEPIKVKRGDDYITYNYSSDLKKYKGA